MRRAEGVGTREFKEGTRSERRDRSRINKNHPARVVPPRFTYKYPHWEDWE